jgi:hypothetical protein
VSRNHDARRLAREALDRAGRNGHVKVLADSYAQAERGDAEERDHREPEKSPATAGAVQAPRFPDPVPCSALRHADESRRWLWYGCLAPGAITLFSALWKAGKTTFLAHLFRAFDCGADFCGLKTLPAKVLLVTEENESPWAERRENLRLGDHISFLVRPFPMKAAYGDWYQLIDFLVQLQARKPADLIVFDTLSNVWPVWDENDAAQAQRALMPLRQLTKDDRAGLLLVHHLRKGDGQEATGSRGSGALPAFADAIIELRRYDAKDRNDRRRVLTGYGRWDDTPNELVVELSADGSGYTAHGDRQATVSRELREVIPRLLPNEAPGLTSDQIRDNWPTEPPPHNQRLREALGLGVDRGDWRREGTGKRGDPYTYWTPVPA